MHMGLGLHQEQTQKLMMTAQMRQAIEVLQCSMEELHEYILQSVDGNPVVEVQVGPYEAAWRFPRRSGFTQRGSDSQHAASPDQWLASEETIFEALSRQIRLAGAPSTETRVALHIVGCLNENGYLSEPLEDIAVRLGVSIGTAEAGLALVQACEPKGIGARSLQECLMLQLPDVPTQLRDVVRQLLEHHLEDVAAGRIAAIAKRLKRQAAEVQAAVDAMKRMHPRPGSAYASARPVYALPDVIVERVSGRYVVMTNEPAQPKLVVNPQYRRWLRHSQDPAIREFISKKVQAAHWLAKCLEQRRHTLYRVADAIVQIQYGFFDHGVTALRPLTLRQVADMLGVHESTVSRATRGKYMLTPRGLLEMKFFFTAELGGSAGPTSAEAAKHLIRECIDREDPARPLSDDAIAKALHTQGINLSRRTVAKYREEMNIAPSWRRRRFEATGG